MAWDEYNCWINEMTGGLDNWISLEYKMDNYETVGMQLLTAVCGESVGLIVSVSKRITKFTVSFLGP